MYEPSLAAQRFVAARLKATTAVTALVPGANIFDRNNLPDVFPCVIVGEGQTIDTGTECGPSAEVFLDIHVWTRSNNLSDTKAIAGAVQAAVRSAETEQDGVAIEVASQSARFLRDPSGEHGHGVITLTINADWSDA